MAGRELRNIQMKSDVEIHLNVAQRYRLMSAIANISGRQRLLGNLTLTTSGLNISAGNDSFAAKVWISAED